MSNPVDYIEKYPERTKRLLGISYQEWQELTKQAISRRLALRGQAKPGAARSPTRNSNQKN